MAEAPPVAQFPEKLAFLFEPARYKVAYGGRGSAKSWSFARAALILGAQRKIRVLCTRELQVSIADSVHKLLTEQIQQLELSSRYAVFQNSIRGRNGAEFIFSGIRNNITKIKSMEGVDVVWVEEAEKVTEESWQVLVPTIRKPGSEIWVSFNPDLEADPTYQRFVKQSPPGAKVVAINWMDNPWFPPELLAEKDYLYRIDSEAADHVWGGQPRKNSKATVLRGRYRVECFEPKPTWHGPYQGADWGFAEDPSTLVRLWVDPAVFGPGGKVERGPILYVEYEAWGVGVDVVKTPELFDRVPDARKYVTRADSARPETISHMQQNGYSRMVAAVKGPGSVEDGVEHLRSYEAIVIHPRCVHTAEEARLWSFKVDKLTGDVLPELVDKHNHCWDAARYGLEPLIKTSGTGMLEYMRQMAAEAKAKQQQAATG